MTSPRVAATPRGAGNTGDRDPAASRFEVVFEAAAVAMLVADDSGRYLCANAAACELFGLPREQLLGRRLDDFARFADGVDPEKAWAVLLASGRARGTVGVRREDGAIRWVELEATANIAPGEHLSVLRDIARHRTGQERAALHDRAMRADSPGEGLRLSDSILRQLPEAVLLADLEGRIRVWSGGAERMYGWSAAEAMGRIANFMHPEEMREEINARIQSQIISTGAFSGELPGLHKDGRSFPIGLEARLLRDEAGAPIGFLGLSRDLTAVKQAEEQRRELLQSEAARAVAEAANRQKDEFLAILGHELRNPLAPILTALNVLRLRHRTDREHEVIERQVKHMVRLVDDLLDVSRIASGKVELKKKPFDLRDAVEHAVEIAGPLLEQRGHVLEVALEQGALPIHGDEARLAQVISNLLNNAARYTSPGGRISVVGRIGEGHVSLQVRDTGVGIAGDLLPRIFDLFVQAYRGPDRSEGGLGLGLAIARSLVELHGGTIAARSDGPGQGSEFEIRLPLGTPQASRPDPAVRQEAARGRPLRILVVDDNVDAALLLAMALEAKGHEARVAHDGPAALEEASRFSPQAVLLDIGLPVMDGYEVARRLREGRSGQELYLLALTGYGQAGDVRRAEEAGFDRHLVKPADVSEILDALASGSGARGPR